MDSSGSLTIDTTAAMALTSFKASVVVGSQIVNSQPFTIQVQQQLEEKLLVQPEKRYEIKIGET